MRHDAHGWWIAEAGLPAPLPPLAEDVDADVVVIGGGYTGMWTAWELLEREPNARVVILEAGQCGVGPSGRNGGFLSSLWLSFPLMREEYGERRARELCEASAETVDMVGAWCAAQEVDAWHREAPHLIVSCAPAQDGAGQQAVDGVEVKALTQAETRAICDSPVFRAGVATRSGATVQPARLAFGLRERLLGRGVRIFEGTRVRALHVDRNGGVLAEAAGGRVRAGAAALAVNAASGQVRRLRNRLTVSSSHIVLTEPVPDVIEALGWTGGEAITDGPRAAALLPHHPRRPHPARLGRRADGGGRAHARARGARRRRGRDDAAGACCGSSRCSRGGGSSTPGAGRSTSPPRTCRRSSRCAAAAPGPPSATRATASGPRTWPGARSPRWRSGAPRTRRAGPGSTRRHKAVPPEPLRVAGATVIRAALARKEAAEEARRARRSDLEGARGGPFDNRTAHRALICR